MERNKVFFLALDGADPALLEQWMDDGSLPNLTALRERSRVGVVEAPRGFGSDAIWPSVYTGVDPSCHGRYYHKQDEVGSYSESGQRKLELQYPTVWESVSDAGRRVAIVELPKAPGPAGICGIEVLDWHSHFSYEHEFRTSPESLRDQILQRYGQPSACPCLSIRYRNPDPATAINAVEQLKTTTSDTRALILDQLKGENWDLFMTSFGALHCAGHQLWHLHDDLHPRHVAARHHGEDPVRELYCFVDSAVGDLLMALPEDCAVVCIAGPGSGPNYVRRELLDDILVKLDSGSGSTARGVVRGLKSLWHIIPGSLRKFLSRHAHTVEKGLKARDRSGRRFYPLWVNEGVGGIRINLRGRELNGCVDSTALDGICSELARAIADIRIADSEEPLALDVFPTRSVYRGPFLHQLPDILIVWNQASPVTAVESPDIGVIRQDTLPDWSGTHTGRSLVMVGTTDRESADLPSDTSIYDIAPTIAALCGVELERTAGRSLTPLAP